MQVYLDDDTVEFIKSAVVDYDWRDEKIIPDEPYQNFGPDYDEDVHDHYNLIELLYRVYFKNKVKFEEE